MGGGDQAVLAHSVDGSPVGHQAEGVLKNAAGVEERQGHAHDALQLLLSPAQPGSSGVLHLIEHLVLPEREGWHQVSSAERFGVAFSSLAMIALDQGGVHVQAGSTPHAWWTGSSYPYSMAILMKPFFLASKTSKLPGCASRDSWAPPTAITTALPPPPLESR